METKSIKELVKTPSNALQLMVDGLKKYSKLENFTVSMSYYIGVKSDEMCYGCAATCAVLNLMNANKHTINKINKLNISSTLSKEYIEITKFDKHEQWIFENAINTARLGILNPLFDFFDLRYNFKLDNRFRLETDNWKKQLPKVRKLIKILQDAGY